MGTQRIDTASRLLAATPGEVWHALTDPEALTRWLPPAGMTGKMHAFDLREGGGFRMELFYGADGSEHAKSTDSSDISEVRFEALVTERKQVQSIDFDSVDPAFRGTMTMTWLLEPRDQSTMLTITAENVPAGISQADHETGLNSSLENLAAFLADASA